MIETFNTMHTAVNSKDTNAFTLSVSKHCQSASNCIFPIKMEIGSLEDLAKACRYDHVGATLTENYRKKDNFLSSDVVILDVDNTHSDEKSDWITPEIVQQDFPNVTMYFVPSRNNMKQKGNAAPRPKFHVYMPIVTISDKSNYEKLKADICLMYSYFDSQAKDATRQIFGVPDLHEQQISLVRGTTTVDIFMAEKVATLRRQNEQQNRDMYLSPYMYDSIPEGQRNTTLHRYACSMLIKFGNSSTAKEKFAEALTKCIPPLDAAEAESIWNSALKFYENIVLPSSDYISPIQQELVFRPDDYTDVEQAKCFHNFCKSFLVYTNSNGFLYYDGYRWAEADDKVCRIYIDFIAEQEKELDSFIELFNNAHRMQEEVPLGMQDIVNDGRKKVLDAMAKELIKYKCFLKQRKSASRIKSTIELSKTFFFVKADIFDMDGFVINTPIGVVSLRDKSVKEHRSTDYITKMTSVAPDFTQERLAEWNDVLKVIFCENQELIDYVQCMVGYQCIGKVIEEGITIAVGDGRNGKSTFWNTILKVLGDYAWTISSDVLLNKTKRNIRNELAELQGKRLVLATEIGEDESMNTAVLKQLCSTDNINAERKFKTPFSFTPVHSIVLCTNHLPVINSNDSGTWRRLNIIPFSAHIESANEKKDFADYLFNELGGVILNWIIDGAVKFIANNYVIVKPKAIEDMNSQYSKDSNIIGMFLQERFRDSKDSRVLLSEINEIYVRWCSTNGIKHILSHQALSKAIVREGYKKVRCSKGILFEGLKVAETPFIFDGSINCSEEINNR